MINQGGEHGRRLDVVQKKDREAKERRVGWVGVEVGWVGGSK